MSDAGAPCSESRREMGNTIGGEAGGGALENEAVAWKEVISLKLPVRTSASVRVALATPPVALERSRG